MVDKTILTKAASNSPSLRTTVPSTVVKQFGLVDGDQLEWGLQAQESKIVILVKPVFYPGPSKNQSDRKDKMEAKE